MATKTETTTTSAPATNGSEAPAGEKSARTKLGWVTIQKFSSIVQAKNLAEFNKKSAEAAEARAAASALKASMTEAISKKLGVPADQLDLSIQEDRVVFYKRPEEKPRKAKTSEKELSL